MLTGAVQLGATSLPLEHRGLQVHWIVQTACMAVLPQDDPLAAEPVVPLAALAERRLIDLSNPFRLRGRIDRALAQVGRPGLARRDAIETNSSVNAQAAVRAGLGVAVLELLTALGLPCDGVAVRPLDTDIPFFFGVITPQAQPVTPQVQAVADALLQAARTLPGFVQHAPQAHAALLQALYGGDAGPTASEVSE